MLRTIVLRAAALSVTWPTALRTTDMLGHSEDTIPASCKYEVIYMIIYCCSNTVLQGTIVLTTHRIHYQVLETHPNHCAKVSAEC